MSNKQVHKNISTIEDPKPGCSTDKEEEIYDYTTITQLRTPKLLNIEKTDTRRDTLPDNCFCAKKVMKNLSDIDLEEFDSNIDPDEFYETISYVKSKQFMEYFQNSVFPNSLGRSLGFKEYEIEKAMSIPGVIFCNLPIENNSKSLACEIIPSVSIEWPVKYTYEFEVRTERPTITDTRKGVRYKWPTPKMIQDIKRLNGVLMPTGYMKKRNATEENELEWEIAFPRAERYIETTMTHAQMKCFLFIITLYKTFIEQDTQKYGLLLDHIRTHMYWECESNYRDWPEHRLGVKILKVIESLNGRLSKARLPDYFIKQHNLLENIPRKYLYHAQTMFHNVVQTPVMYFIKALKNLQYTNNNKFYPHLNFNELYKILTTEGVKYANPSLVSEVSLLRNTRRTKFEDPEQCVKSMQILKNKEKFLRKKLEQKKKEMNLNLKRKESVDLEWTFEKSFDAFKTRSILIFFTKQFIAIAKKSTHLGCAKQSLLYIKQAWYLTKILEEIDSCIEDALYYQDIIAKEEEIAKQAAVMEQSESIPPTPKRNSIQFAYDSQPPLLNNSFIINNTNNVNVNNLQRIPSSLKTRPLNRHTSINNEDVKLPEPKLMVLRSKSIKEGGFISRKSVAFANDQDEKITATYL